MSSSGSIRRNFRHIPIHRTCEKPSPFTSNGMSVSVPRPSLNLQQAERSRIASLFDAFSETTASALFRWSWLRGRSRLCLGRMGGGDVGKRHTRSHEKAEGQSGAAEPEGDAFAREHVCSFQANMGKADRVILPHARSGRAVVARYFCSL